MNMIRDRHKIFFRYRKYIFCRKDCEIKDTIKNYNIATRFDQNVCDRLMSDFKDFYTFY
jgi:hypothetical protein